MQGASRTWGRRRPCRDERGVTLIFVALTAAVILAVAGLAIDGGMAFTDRRGSQNTADAAALAGTEALNKVLLTTGSEASVYQAVQTVVNANANATTFTCSLIDQTATVLGACPTSNTGTGFASTVDGVQVSVSRTRQTSFIRVVGGNSTYTAAATAAAQIEAYQPTNISAPVLLCAVGSSDSRSGGSGISPPILNTDNSINQAAIGQTYDLKGNAVDKECGTNGSYKGIVDSSQTYSLPGPWAWTTGNHSGPTRVTVAGDCGGEAIGCEIAVPLCYEQSGLPSNELECVRFGFFKITSGDANSYAGQFLGTNLVVTSGPGGGRPGSDDARVIKLSV